MYDIKYQILVVITDFGAQPMTRRVYFASARNESRKPMVGTRTQIYTKQSIMQMAH
jgi:hypothetical protein